MKRLATTPRRSSPRRLSFALQDVLGPDERPLEEVFEQAINVIHNRPASSRSGGPDVLEANWLAMVAIRAVCEAIIAGRCLLLPLAVDMRFRTPDNAVKRERKEAA